MSHVKQATSQEKVKMMKHQVQKRIKRAYASKVMRAPRNLLGRSIDEILHRVVMPNEPITNGVVAFIILS